MRFSLRGPAALLLAAALCACGDSDAPARALQAESALPPGQSGLITADGQAMGSASGDPADYGEHVDDQRLLYWSFEFKDGRFQKSGEPLVPKDGVEVYFDAYGVPAIYADHVRDAWYAAGYVAAQQRLFLMDAVRRTGKGTLAELTGCGTVPADLQTRVLTYTREEYQAFFDRLEQDSKDAIEGYVEGANAWIDELAVTPELMPAEYQLLTSLPEPFEPLDVMAAGVLITRTVAAEGGNEFLNIHMLRALEDQLGAAAGRNAFLDLVWDEDRSAVTTVPASSEFSNQAIPPQGRLAAFHARADWALTLPDTIWKGDGTGHAAAPCSPQDLSPMAPPEAANPAALAVSRIQDFPKTLHGGSFAVAISGARSKRHGGLLISEPQLGYTYPTLLYELEMHVGDYHSRGVSVPGLPTVGIGYTPHLAWALTTGYSKTIDSFVERICKTSELTAGTCTANQYFHQGAWKDMDCRTETVRYRAAQSGAPVGPPEFTRDYEICRTVHGPIVARDAEAGLARSLSYAMWQHEIDNIEGVREWSRARNLDEFRRATSRVSWNENVTVATRDGEIAFFHPGRYPVRPAAGDQRFPLPGTGEFDFAGILPFERMPHAINPEQGYLANWNNKPALGWLEGEGIGPTSRPGGPGQRVTSLLDTLKTRNDWTYASLKDIDRIAGTRDPRAREYLPVLLDFRARAKSLSATERAALDLLARWDRSHYGPDLDIEDPEATDGPAATVFGAYVAAIRDELFAFTKDLVIDAADPGDATDDLTVFSRSAGVGSHVFDQSVMDNVALRILAPATSSLPLRHDFLDGRSRDEVLRIALKKTIARLAADYNGGNALTPADLDKCRRLHPRSTLCSLTGVIGPGSETTEGQCGSMPYQDRGSWVHLVGYERGG